MSYVDVVNKFEEQLRKSFDTAFNDVLENSTITTNIKPVNEVKHSCYKRQKFMCEDADRNVSNFYAWTLFVIWNDDTMDCWFKAKDVANGIGYHHENAAYRLKTFLSDNDRMIEWHKISGLLFTPTIQKGNISDEWGDCYENRGIKEASTNLQRNAFLTEEGLYEIYQFSPKCTKFRRAVANLLRSVRQSINAPITYKGSELKRLMKEAVTKERQQWITEKNEEINALKEEFDRTSLKALTTSAIAEKDHEVAELRQNLEQVRVDYAKRVNDLEHEITVKTSQIDHLQQILENSTNTVSELETLIVTNAQDVEKLKETKLRVEEELSEERKKHEQFKCVKRRERQVLVNDMKRLRRKGLEYLGQIRTMNNAMNKCNFLYFDASLVHPSERLACCLVYIGQCLALPEETWRNCFLCIRGQRQHVRRTLKSLYQCITSETKLKSRNLIRMIEMNHLRIDKEHLCNPKRQEYVDTLYDLEHDADFNALEHKRILVDTINSVLLMRTPRLNVNDCEDTDGQTAEDIEDLDIEDLNDKRSFPFQQYGGFQNSNVYICTKYFPDVDTAFDQFDRYSQRFSSVESLGLRLELINSIFNETRGNAESGYDDEMES